AAKTREVFEKLRAAMGASGQVENAGYSLNPQYHFPEGGGMPTLKGYSAASSITLTTEDLSAVGRLIDVAAAAGSVEIRQVQFTTKDATTARAQALREATRIARAYAEALAAAQGMELGKVLSLDGV